MYNHFNITAFLFKAPPSGTKILEFSIYELIRHGTFVPIALAAFSLLKDGDGGGDA